MQSSACVTSGVEWGSTDLIMHSRDLTTHDTLLRGCKTGLCSHLSLYDCDEGVSISCSHLQRACAPASHITHAGWHPSQHTAVQTLHMQIDNGELYQPPTRFAHQAFAAYEPLTMSASISVFMKPPQPSIFSAFVESALLFKTYRDATQSGQIFCAMASS